MASARDLLDNAARVRTMATKEAYTCLLAQQSSGKIAVSASDDDLRFTAASEGWLSQTNNLLHTGLTTDPMHDGTIASSEVGLVTAAAAAQEDTALVISSRQAVDHIPAPAKWTFSTPERINNMVGRVRTRSMEMMANRDLSGSNRKKAYTVRTALANNDKTYVTIAKDMLPTKPGSQDVLNVCLTQASLEMQMKK